MAYGSFNSGGEALAVDTTLKVSGAAADAKATGDALAGLHMRTVPAGLTFFSLLIHVLYRTELLNAPEINVRVLQMFLLILSF